MSPAQNARPFPVIAAGAWSTRRPNTPASRKEGNAMASAIERRLPMIGGPPGDDVVFHGHAGAFHAPPGAGGRLVTIETPAGQPTGVLHHLVRHSPTGFSWGYRGSVPADLARCLLAAVLGHAAVCPSCAGTTVVIYDFERDAVEPYDPGRHAADLAERCSACGDGLVIPTALYQQFKDDVVARWPQDDDWRITAGDIRSWLARHGTEGEW
jgi:hypothetical protein